MGGIIAVTPIQGIAIIARTVFKGSGEPKTPQFF